MQRAKMLLGEGMITAEGAAHRRRIGTAPGQRLRDGCLEPRIAVHPAER